MAEKKKMNTYLKYGLILLACTLVGGVLGFISTMAEGPLMGLRILASEFSEIICRYLVIEFIVLLVVELIFGETNMRKMKAHCKALENVEDEEADRIEYEMEKDAAWGVGTLNVIAFLSMVLLATGYSMDYIKSVASLEEGVRFLGACVLFMVIYIYNGLWSVRQVKLQQKFDPTKKGDPTSTKFTEQWVESCDEAEREMIYRSTYKSYIMLSKWIPVLMVVTMLSHLVWNTGIMAIIVVGIVWTVQNVAYLKSCVEIRGMRLN